MDRADKRRQGSEDPLPPFPLHRKLLLVISYIYQRRRQSTGEGVSRRLAA